MRPRALLALLAGIALGACTAIVPGASDEAPCVLRTDGSDPCLPIGRTCVEGYCRLVDVPCVIGGDGVDPCLERGRMCVDGFCRAPEVCNGSDDDEDGRIDEDPASDTDGDQFTWCGGGIPALADCDDTDPGVHPADPARGIAAPEEICDGRDNQCDGREVDLIEATNCTGSQRCSRTAGRCVDPICTYPEFRCAEGFQCVDGACTPGDCTRTGCSAPQVCDPVTRACVDMRPIGSPCETDAQCADQVCMPSREALGLEAGLTAGARKICTRACCDDRDCPAGQACWASGSGARGCVDRALLAMGSLGAPDSTERSCSNRNACEPGSCLPGSFEAYDRRRFGFTCGSTTRTDRVSCTAGDQCESGICLGGHEFWSWSRLAYVEAGPCTSACRNAADCGIYARAWNGSADGRDSGDEIQMACLTVVFSGSTDWTQACFETSGQGPGATCTTDSECLERACIGGVCRATCCSNADCPGEICRPFVDGDHWEMRCAPPLTIL